MKEILINLAKENIKPTEVNDSEIIFEEGYETYEFYKAILEAVKEKLYIFGRKNRKLFTRSNAKLRELLEKGIDFKCLFLSDKASGSILKIAQENANFEKDLNRIIEYVKSSYKSNIDCFRKYDFQQLKRIIIVDDVVIYAPVEFENGNVKHFTKSKFTIYKDNSTEAIDLIHEFNKIWNMSKEL